MSWVTSLRRRFSALFGWLRSLGGGRAPALPPGIERRTAVAAGGQPVTPVAAPTAPAPSGSLAAPDSTSTAPRPALAGEMGAARAVAPVAAAPVAAVAVDEVRRPAAPQRPARPGAAPVAAMAPAIDPVLGALNVRQYFGRMLAAMPAGLMIDFTDWPSATVERFFLAMSSPNLTRRREPPTSGVEQVSLTNAFQGFEWD